jgi:hypothetical protein
MDESLKFYFGNFLKSAVCASDTSINEVQRQAGFELPQDYIAAMKEFNGGEGEVGVNSWLCLFSIEDLLKTNNDYKLLMEQIPDYFLFGKDAADTGYAFNKLDQSIYSFGLMSDFSVDPIDFCASSFVDFA